MKLTVKTLRGTRFQIRVQHNDTIMAVKKNIEEIHGKDSYPCGQQLLLHNGKVLKDKSTLDENQVSEDGFIVLMLTSIPVAAEVVVPVVGQGANTTDVAPRETGFSGIPNTAPLDLFPQGASHAGGAVGGGSLDFLRNNQQRGTFFLGFMLGGLLGVGVLLLGVVCSALFGGTSILAICLCFKV